MTVSLHWLISVRRSIVLSDCLFTFSLCGRLFFGLPVAEEEGACEDGKGNGQNDTYRAGYTLDYLNREVCGAHELLEGGL